MKFKFRVSRIIIHGLPGPNCELFILKQTILLNDLLSEVLRDGNEDEDVGGGEGVDECDGLKRGCKLEAMAA